MRSGGPDPIGAILSLVRGFPAPAEGSLSGNPTCPKCQSTELRWVTVRKHVPVDTLQCTTCGVATLEEDWTPPILPLFPDGCMNCGDQRDGETCPQCALRRDEDIEVHDELRAMISPDHGLFDASRIANRAGRRLMALKLATAAAASNENGRGEQARALRVWLLAAIGEATAALEDAKAWVESSGDASALAWASYGQQLQANAFPGAAADAYVKALKKDPSQVVLRAKRAQILMQMHREGQAIDEAIRVFEFQGADDPSIAIVLKVAEDLCDLFESQLRDEEIERMLDKADPYVARSAMLLAHRARLAGKAGDTSAAKRDLKAARRLNPELPIYERVERAMKPAQSSWWRW